VKALSGNLDIAEAVAGARTARVSVRQLSVISRRHVLRGRGALDTFGDFAAAGLIPKGSGALLYAR
jgi:hypothetical protein